MNLFSSIAILATAFAAESPQQNWATGEAGAPRGLPETVQEQADIEGFLALNKQLKEAVCDENFASRAPSLESISQSEKANSVLRLPLPKSVAEHEVLSFLLGDAVSGLQSEYVRDQVGVVLKQRNIASLEQARMLTGEAFLDLQAAILAVKRRVALDICEGLVNVSRLKKLIGSKPNRFIFASAAGKPEAGQPSIEAVDREGRFAQMGPRYLVAGWLEPFEVDRVFFPSRIYRRLSNPLTNNTQAIEVVSTSRNAPLGILTLSREEPAADWAAYKAKAELPETRQKQVEAYRQRLEAEALKALQEKPQRRNEIRDLQEFYKNLFQAYQLFPNEKQFDAYAKSAGKGATFDEVVTKTLGPGFLNELRLARVNGSFVSFNAFKPDPKLHAIFEEYSARLAKLQK